MINVAVTGLPCGRVSVVPGGRDAVGEGDAAITVLVDSPGRTVEVTCAMTGVSLASKGASVGTGGVSLGVDAKIAVWVRFGVGKVNGVGEAAPRTEQAFKTRLRTTSNVNRTDLCRNIG